MTPREKYRLLCAREESIPLFSRDWWLDIVCGQSNWDVILVEQKDKIVAAMPLYKPLPNVVSMPSYTQAMGIWFPEESADSKYTTILGKRQMLCKALIDSLGSYSSFLQRLPYSFTDWLPFYWEGFKQTTRYTYILQNINNKERLWEEMAVNTRRNITKAKEKNGIVVKRGISIPDFMRVLKATFQRQNMSVPKDLQLLKQIIEVCRERQQGDIWGGYDKDGKLHAAVFIIWQKSSAYYIAGGGNPAVRDSGAHSLVMWKAIQEVSHHTLTFDFEGSMLPGVERFFREFGARQMPYFTITKGNLSLLQKIRIKLRSNPT
ncbi:GNAT family N-acetyltransferase [Massilibacteroides sp.]|uniref:GNAT family N-acetyltransferase n=1 Tax=Massilibacteroides sp. TaxID=2034766 RepID=UPI00260500E9|nr:GNAT family N-acetyltransferase [Massilibacteroides sp.]MDD4516518.1 GNAT family N-acetyltransferase [Massilibacteroides sp.]